MFLVTNFIQKTSVQSAGAVEYTNCISSEGYNSPSKYPGYEH